MLQDFGLRTRTLASNPEAMLLPNVESSRSVELPELHNDEPKESSASTTIDVVSSQCKDRALFVGLLLAMVVPSFTILAVLSSTWIDSPSQRGWLIIGFGFYIVSALQGLWTIFVRVYDQMFYLRVEVHRLASSTLFDAITNAVETKSEQCGRTCSWDQEARQEHDKLTGNFTTKLRFWSSAARTFVIHLHAGANGQSELPSDRRLAIRVLYRPGEEVVLGRDSRQERCEVLVLSVRTSKNMVLADKKSLCRWLDSCYTAWVKPVDGLVNIHALQETSTDWVPNWAFERAKPIKKTSGTGHSFFLERTAFEKICADAKLWAGSALRVYMVTGPPGVGKSEFTIWLAAQLDLPIYRLCLTSPRLTDDRLSQLLSQSAISHNSVLVQVDEFQEAVRHWMQGKTSSGDVSSGVTPGGFCECLQGSTAMGRGVIVLTGTGDIVEEHIKRRLPAVFRRMHREAHLGWMSGPDVARFFNQFLKCFLPHCSSLEWAQWEQRFLVATGPWAGSRSISVDMVKQFFMRQITEASCMGLGDFVCIGQTGLDEFMVHPSKYNDFFDLVCDADSATIFLEEYSPVHQAQQPITDAAHG